MDPLVTSALIKTGGSLLGGLFGRKSNDQSKRSAHLAEQMNRQSMMHQAGLYGERNKQIRLRVRDAKAAGLHPLFALGASTAGFSPTAVLGGGDGQSETGSFAGDSISAAAEGYANYIEAREGRKQAASERDRAAAFADAQRRRVEAETQLINTRKALVEQQINSTRPADQDPTAAATKHEPYYKIYRMPDGTLVRLINSETGLDELSQLKRGAEIVHDAMMPGPRYDKQGNPRFRNSDRVPSKPTKPVRIQPRHARGGYYTRDPRKNPSYNR